MQQPEIMDLEWCQKNWAMDWCTNNGLWEGVRKTKQNNTKTELWYGVRNNWGMAWFQKHWVMEQFQKQ